MTDLDTDAILAALESPALAGGRFERVNRHEPKSAPGSGLTLAIWADYLGPLPAGSALAITTGLLVFQARAFSNLIAEPQDAIDPNLVAAVSDLTLRYSADFELDGLVRNIDLLGQSGRRLEAQAGYLEQDRRLFRVMTITIPLIINDLWPQVG